MKLTFFKICPQFSLVKVIFMTHRQIIILNFFFSYSQKSSKSVTSDKSNFTSTRIQKTHFRISQKNTSLYDINGRGTPQRPIKYIPHISTRFIINISKIGKEFLKRMKQLLLLTMLHHQTSKLILFNYIFFVFFFVFLRQ